ncbi:MAG: hypothetical protein JWN30_2521 [Bacilli bacterium]|nr:hypothetical protein [Bacilli bacterium]
MNKKRIAVGTTLAVGSVMLVSSAFASAASSSGYDLYKTALKNMVNVSSATTEMEVIVQDNGSLLGQVDSVIKTDRTNGADTSSGTFDLKGAGSEQSSSFFNSGGKLVLKNVNSDVYQVSQLPQQQDKQVQTASVKQRVLNPYVEKVVDALVGNIANNITLQTQADGTRKINLQLTDTQIPALGQAIAGLVLSHAASTDEQPNRAVSNDNQAMTTIMHSVPKLTDNIKINSVNWSAAVNSAGLLQDQNGSFEITGQDAAGKAHDLRILVSLKESNLNQTTPDTIDLTGKQVQVIQPQHRNQNETAN